MIKEDVLERIAESGVVAVIRMKDTPRLQKVIEAVRNGGVKAIEITMTLPNAVEVIRSMAASKPDDVVLGAGTVTDVETARAVIDAGAQFVVGPILNLDIIRLCKEREIACMPGCYTPTEIFAAWQAGADIVKVFPATSLGPKYLKDIAGPFPLIRMMPTGGVTVENVGEWIAAGAVAAGIGSDLLDKKAIDEGRYEVLTERAARMTENVRIAKSKLRSA
ncbi:MAG: bifunctional 4-hydroxy-2-oxoglutarate aldolase/2-dehydro-3-deoxy-phosphogluconate aldolase [Ignavibacteriales bacterium]|nr:bifunctional 4-hydroxy-2-oxoglutarate aldolase/2-dehydro-3-deoxy-phosphogluconate aldolase [Ignavibacteriales bacterium]